MTSSYSSQRERKARVFEMQDCSLAKVYYLFFCQHMVTINCLVKGFPLDISVANRKKIGEGLLLYSIAGEGARGDVFLLGHFTFQDTFLVSTDTFVEIHLSASSQPVSYSI